MPIKRVLSPWRNMLGICLLIVVTVTACQRSAEPEQAGTHNEPTAAVTPSPQANRPTCPVCNMFADLSPQWMARIEYKDGSVVSFDVPQHMLKFYLNAAEYTASDHHKDKANIVRMTVNDFNSKSAIDAQTAFYVFGSKQQTPMGEGAIPFKLKSDAETFQKAHGGQLVAFNQITSALLEANQ